MIDFQASIKFWEKLNEKEKDAFKRAVSSASIKTQAEFNRRFHVVEKKLKERGIKFINTDTSGFRNAVADNIKGILKGNEEAIEMILAGIKKAGYKAAFSVVASYNTRDTYKYALKRTMIYNSTNIEKLKKILEKKPLWVKDIYPADGDVIEDRTPELKATLVEDSFLNTWTVKFKMGRVVLKDSHYNPTTKELTFYYKKKMSSGTHNARVVAQGKDGEEHEYAWFFITGTPTKMTLHEGEENNITQEVKEEANE